MKKFIAFFLILISIRAFAQDSTNVGGSPLEGLPSWVYVAAAVLLGIYEVIVRFIPTVNNYSIIGMIIKVIRTVFPNNKQGGGTFQD